ncbi:MAG TPA: glycoside hydrolase family 6 protein, partial [Acidimicrobiales bacterium]|nr:glycoside hydrolase family 6 protein [Acidimicrobiales bacterium]
MKSGTRIPWRRMACLAVIALFGALALAPAAAEPPSGGDDLYVPPAQPGARRQIVQLTAQGDRTAAAQIRAITETPQAAWFEAGTPRSVRRDVHVTVTRAAAHHTIPVLVTYNIPFRDCAQFSAGGATTQAEYEAWIDGFAAGIGDREAIVILEPDGLGIIPWYDPYGDADGSGALEWCQPAEADPDTAAAERFAMLNDAVDVLDGAPHVTTYLDGTHAAWLGVG